MGYGDMFTALKPWWITNYKKEAEENAKKKSSSKRDRDDEDDAGRSNKRRKTGNGRGGGRRNNGDKDKSSGDDKKKNNFQQNCKLHPNVRKPHAYGDCFLCPSSKDFNETAAIDVYNKGKTKAGVEVPQWWKETMERRVLKKSSPKKQSEQQQPQQQQYLVQTGTPIQPQQGTAFAIVGQQQFQQLPPAPAGNQAPPGQIAPTFATGTTPTPVTSAQPALRQVRDANGNIFFIQA